MSHHPPSDELSRLRFANERLSQQLLQLLSQKKGAPPQGVQRQLLDFIERVELRQGEDRTQVLLEELRWTIGCDRAALLFEGGDDRLIVSHLATASGEEVPLPYVVSREREREYCELLLDANDSGGMVRRIWSEAIALYSHFEIAALVAHPLSSSEKSLISLEWQSQEFKEWDTDDEILFLLLIHYIALDEEKRHLNEEMQELRDQMEALVRAMPSALVVLDFLGMVTAWSGEAQAYFGLEPEEAIGCRLEELIPEVASLVVDIPALLQEKQATSAGAFLRRCSDGTFRVLQPSLFHMMESDRGEICLRFDDITKHAELIQQLLQAQQMENVGGFAAGTAHGFSPIFHALSAVNQKRFQNPKAESALNDASALLLAQGEALSERLLDLAAPVFSTLKEIDLREALLAFVECAADQERARLLHCRVVESPAPIWGDLSTLHRALQQIVDNSCESMKGGECIEIELAPFSSDESFAQRHSRFFQKEWWRLRIADQGEGMTPEVRARLFDPFFSTQAEGVGRGLGLTIVSQVLKLHRGVIEVESHPGGGTVIDLFFPALSDTPFVEETPSALVMAGESCGSIDQLLEERGWRVFRAKSAPDLVRHLQTMHRFDLLLLHFDFSGFHDRDLYWLVRQLAPQQQLLLLSETPSFLETIGVTDPFCREVKIPLDLEQFSSLLQTLLLHRRG